MFDEACFRAIYFKFSPNSTGRIAHEQANRKQASESMFEKSTIAVEPKFLFQEQLRSAGQCWLQTYTFHMVIKHQ